MKMYLNLNLFFKLFISFFNRNKYSRNNSSWSTYVPFDKNIVSYKLVHQKKFSKSLVEIKKYKEDIYPLY